MRGGRLALAFLLCAQLLASGSGAATTLHSLWEVRGKHNTVYLLGSIHVLRASDYPLAPAVLDAYAHCRSLVMEIDLSSTDEQSISADLLESATLPDGKTLADVLGPQRHSQAQALARQIGVDLGNFERYAPWFAAEGISELQLAQLGFDSRAGVEMYFLDLARKDGKTVTGLETVHDQIALFEALSMEQQADYLLSSLRQARDLPREVTDMVHAWERGDVSWFASELKSETDSDPALFEALLTARNRKWLPRIEALLNEDRNYMVIVGTGHLAGKNSVIDLLARDGIAAIQH